MQLFKQKFPQKNQFLITTFQGQKALAQQSFIDEIFVFEKNKLSILQLLEFSSELRSRIRKKSERPLILQAHRSFRSSLLALLLKMPRITYLETSLGCFFASQIPRIALFHEAHRIGLLLEPLGVTREEILGSLPRLDAGSLRSDFPHRDRFDVSVKNIFIAVAPGSVWATKRWEISRFGQLIQRLLESTPHTVVVLGSVSEVGLIESFPKEIKESPRFINLAAKTQLEDLPSLYPYFSLLISNDSSPIHYASSLNIPTIALFLATSSQMGFAPLADESIVLENKILSCRPCGLHGHQKCPLDHFQCMRSINVEEVLMATRRLLGSTEGMLI